MRCPTTFVLGLRLIGTASLLALLLVGCSGDAGVGGSNDRFTELPTVPAGSGTPAPPTPTPDTSTPVPEFVTQLLDPGPTLDAPERVFFRNGRDLWSLAGDEVSPTLEDTRFGPYATSPHGQRVAVVVLKEVDSHPGEAVYVTTDGEALGDPILPPRIISGPGAEPSITRLVWSRDATMLGIVSDNAQVEIVRIATQNGGPPFVAAEISLPDEVTSIDRLDWSSTSQGIAILGRSDDGHGTLWVASFSGEVYQIASATLNGQRSISDIAWLPGRGRIAFVEERGALAPSVGGSMFSVAPDGSGRELLVSTGNFAPAAEIDELSASPGSRFIAFTVDIPGPEGEPTFHSAWLVNIDSGELIRVPVNAEFRVTDLWWTTSGLVWRGVHRDAEVVEEISDYVGFEPFLIGRFSPDTGESQAIFQSTAN